MHLGSEETELHLVTRGPIQYFKVCCRSAIHGEVLISIFATCGCEAGAKKESVMHLLASQDQ
jgi:hypothetical protein